MEKVDLSDIFEGVEVHEQVGDSSTYCATVECVAAQIRISQKKENREGKWVCPSRQHLIDHLPAKFWLFYDGNPDVFGIYAAHIEHALDFIRCEGVCLEDDYPSRPEKGRNPIPLPVPGTRYKIKSWGQIKPDVDFHTRAKEKLKDSPLITFVPVYSSFYDLRERVYKGPLPNERYLGCHTIIVISFAVEYVEDSLGNKSEIEVYGIRNSWGNTWAEEGSCVIYAHLENFWSGFWYPEEVYLDRAGFKRQCQNALIVETNPPYKVQTSDLGPGGFKRQRQNASTAATNPPSKVQKLFPAPHNVDRDGHTYSWLRGHFAA